MFVPLGSLQGCGFIVFCFIWELVLFLPQLYFFFYITHTRVSDGSLTYLDLQHDLFYGGNHSDYIS